MEQHWVYEVRNAQTAFEACFAIDRNYTPDEATGLAVYSREGRDDFDHLYVQVVSKNPPQGRIHGVDEILSRFGHRTDLTEDDLLDPRGLQFLASGPIDAILAGLLWHYPGEIELHFPEGVPPIYWAG
jgi:hypothetical protein